MEIPLHVEHAGRVVVAQARHLHRAGGVVWKPCVGGAIGLIAILPGVAVGIRATGCSPCPLEKEGKSECK